MARIVHPQPTLIGIRDVTLGGETVSCAVRRSSRARRVRLEVGGKYGLAVTIPRGFSLGLLPDLLQQKAKWILRHLEQQRQTGVAFAGSELKSGDVIPYLGRELRLVVQIADVDDVEITLDRLQVSLHSGGALSRVLKCWYRTQAERVLKARVAELCARLGVSCRRVTIRAARTRWGSCSHRGCVNLNWKLIMAPAEVMDYVILHELAHLWEMNHSKRFWQIVGQYCPEWREHRKWLKEHETALAAVLPG